MTGKIIDLDIHEGLACLTLANGSGNVMDIPMLDALAVAAASLAARKPRAILLQAEGKNFCVGGDIRSFAGAADRGAILCQMAGTLHKAVISLHALSVPIIAAVQGAAAGAGFSLAIGADLVVAGRSASFSTAYTAIGFSSDGGASYFLPRLIGLRRTQELVLLNRRLTAEEALQWGLVTSVVEDDALAATAKTLALKIAAGPSLAFSAMKKLFAASPTASLEEQLAAEARSIAATGASEDGKEGLAAFLERRAAKFSGEG